MRALIVCQFYESAHGGGIVVARLLRQLLVERGHRVDVLCLEGGDDPQPGTVHRLRPLPLLSRNLARQFLLFLNNGFFDRWFIRQLDRLKITAGQYDVVHCQDFLGVRLARAIADRTGAQWGVTLHEFLPRQMSSTVSARWLGRLIGATCVARDRALLPDYRAATWLAGVSRAVSESAAAFLGPSGSRVHTVYNAYTPGFAPPAEPERRESGACRFLFVGRLSPEKGIDLLVDAFRGHPTQDTLSILGLDGALRGMVERAAALDRRIQLLPPVGYEGMAAQYREHDVVCCPAMWEEPFGLTTLEARACRRVVLGTRRGGIPEILEGYPRAVLVESRGRRRDDVVADLRAGLAQAAALIKTPVPETEEQTFMQRFNTIAFADAYERLYSICAPGFCRTAT